MNDAADAEDLSALSIDDCRTCGACCAYSADWPRFSLESEEALSRIPEAYVDHDKGRMRCNGNRCVALQGKIGVAATCTVYEARPIVCRDCLPGDEACLIARRHHGLSTAPARSANK